MVAIYCRISGKKAEGRDVSIEDQEAQGIAFANSIGMPYRTYKDVGISGAKNEVEERPMFAEMFEDMEKGYVNSVFAIDQSRIERNSRVWQLFVYAVTTNDCKYYEGGDLVDFEDPQTKFITGVISLANELYAAITGQKVKSANRRNALKGKGHGEPPYGYKKDEEGYLIIDEEFAPYVREIFQWSLDGIGTYTIAKKLIEAGVPTKSSLYGEKSIIRKDKYTGREIKYLRKNVKWRGNVVHGMLTNPVYKGERHYADVVAKIDEIVSKEMWDLVNKNLEKNKKNVGPKTKFKYLLNGIVFCAECGSEYRGKIKASGRNTTYYCKGKSQGKSCGSKRGLNIPKLDSFILNHLFESEELHNKLSNLKKDSDKEEKLKGEIDQLIEKKKEIEASVMHFKNLVADYRIKEDYIDEYLKVKKDLEEITEEIKIKKKSLAMQSQVQRQARIDKIFGEFDYTLNFDQIKKSVHSIIESIHIQHLPEQKNFLVQLNYRGFNKKSVFATDHTQMKWINMSHHEVVPLTDEDIRDQDDLIEYLAENQNWSREKLVDGLKHFEVWDEKFQSYSYPELLNEIKKVGQEEMVKDGQKSIINIETSNIALKKEALYHFNKN